MFIKLTQPLFMTPRTYPAGSVVEVDEKFAQDLIKAGIGEPDDGPVSEPEPEDDDNGGSSKKPKRPTEDPTRTAVDPRAQTAHHAVKKG